MERDQRCLIERIERTKVNDRMDRKEKERNRQSKPFALQFRSVSCAHQEDFTTPVPSEGTGFPARTTVQIRRGLRRAKNLFRQASIVHPLEFASSFPWTSARYQPSLFGLGLLTFGRLTLGFNQQTAMTTVGYQCPSETERRQININRTK